MSIKYSVKWRFGNRPINLINRDKLNMLNSKDFSSSALLPSDYTDTISQIITSTIAYIGKHRSFKLGSSL